MRTWPALLVSGLAASDAGDGSRADLLSAFLTDYDVVAVEERSDDAWQVSFATASERGRAADGLRGIAGLDVAEADIPDEDWAARSQANLRSVQVGRIVVAPPWDVPAACETLVVIQPSMGFGTGHHATTRLCLDALQHLPLAGTTVLDAGTGSGVLAIAASLLGAASVIGVDNDPDAIAAAHENLGLNRGARVGFAVSDLRSCPTGPFDVVVANLTGGLLAAAAADLTGRTAARGRLILSGIMSSEADDVLSHYAGWTTAGRSEEDGWVCVTLERSSRG